MIVNLLPAACAFYFLAAVAVSFFAHRRSTNDQESDQTISSHQLYLLIGCSVPLILAFFVDVGNETAFRLAVAAGSIWMFGTGAFVHWRARHVVVKGWHADISIIGSMTIFGCILAISVYLRMN